MPITEPLRNYRRIFTISIQSQGHPFLRDVLFVVLWLICVFMTLFVLIGSLAMGEMQKGLGVGLVFFIPVFLLTLPVLLVLRKWYVWLRVTINPNHIRGVVLDVNQIYVTDGLVGSSLGWGAMNAHALVSVSIENVPHDILFFHRNKSYFDLLGKELNLKICASDPALFRVLGRADGVQVEGKTFISLKRANTIVAVSVAIAVVVGLGLAALERLATTGTL